MFESPIITILWALGMALVGLVYGEYAVRLARKQSLTVFARLHGLIVLYAIAVGFTAIPTLIWMSYSKLPARVAREQLWGIALVGLWPLFLWYLFDWPLRLVRAYSRSARPEPHENHPLDGTWSARASFLDQIVQDRASAEPRVDPKLRGDDRPSALDRVARLRSVDVPASEDPAKTR